MIPPCCCQNLLVWTDGDIRYASVDKFVCFVNLWEKVTNELKLFKTEEKGTLRYFSRCCAHPTHQCHTGSVELFHHVVDGAWWEQQETENTLSLPFPEQFSQNKPNSCMLLVYFAFKAIYILSQVKLWIAVLSTALPFSSSYSCMSYNVQSYGHIFSLLLCRRIPRLRPFWADA